MSPLRPQVATWIVGLNGGGGGIHKSSQDESVKRLSEWLQATPIRYGVALTLLVSAASLVGSVVIWGRSLTWEASIISLIGASVGFGIAVPVAFAHRRRNR